MQIIPDPLFAFFMALPFVVSTLALWQLLVKPYRAYLDERDAATVGARHDAAHTTEHAAHKVAELEARLAKAREEAAAIRGVHRARALEHEQKVIETARRAAEGEVTAALQQIVAESAAARATLRGTVDELSGDIASSVLGRPVRAGSV